VPARVKEKEGSPQRIRKIKEKITKLDF